MNKQLLELRKKFKGQTTKVEGHTFDNSPIPEAVYVGKVTRSEVKEGVDKKNPKVATLQHRMMFRIEVGEHKGRTVFPFSPDLLNADPMKGIMACAQNIQCILGAESVPGRLDKDGSFELKMDAFLDEVESLAQQCEGELIEFSVKNQKPRPDGSHLDKVTGKPRQNIYLKRGLGADKAAVMKNAETKRVVESVDPGASMSMGATKRKKPVAK